MINLEQIKNRISEGEEIEEIINEVSWKEFEEMVGEIIKTHDYNVYNCFRFKTNRNYEIDLVCVKENIILNIDCKQWDRGRYKNTGLKYAVSEQKNRVCELVKFLKRNVISKKILGIELKKTKFIPLIVTWFEEDLKKYDEVIVVPVWKLNEFLLDISEYT